MGETNPQTPMDVGSAPGGARSARPRTKKPVLFGRYELLNRFRMGGMAEVWTARRLGGGEQVLALKRLLPSFTDEADYVAMFRDEARLSQQLVHPNIVATIDLGQVDDSPFLVLEHVRGQHVAAIIRKARERSEPVPMSIALRITLDVCAALGHAHALADASGQPLGIVHRDVSPTNILVAYDGAVKLIDFGIAKSTEQLMRTQAGLLKGKHGYLSPEQAQGDALDQRSDLFSLAICAWEMLAAERLFLGSSDFSSIVRVKQAVVPALSGRNPNVPAALEAVLQRALAQRPDDRYASAEELSAALLEAAEVEPADDELLSAYMREIFADEIALDASEPVFETLPYEGTGLLDAFDDLEPVSALSALAPPPREDEESGAIAVRTAPSETIEEEEELELTELSADGAANESDFEVVREPEHDGDTDDDATEDITAVDDSDTSIVEPAKGEVVAASPEAASVDEPSAAAPADDADEPVTADEPVAAAVADAEITDASEPGVTPMDLNAPAYAEAEQQAVLAEQVAAEPAAEDDDMEERDEPTRVVAYRSVASGELDAAKAAEAEQTVQAPASTLPGMGAVEWDDEDMSTHLYDGPSAGALEAQTAQAVHAGSTPSVAGSVARPSVAPFSSRPSMPVSAPRSVPPGAASVPPALLHPVAAARGALPNRPWLLPALIATVGVVVLGAIWLFQGPNIGTIQLTTQPPDARVTFDGRPVQGNLSPFVIANVSSGEQHKLEVARAGYRTWSSQLVVAPGQTLQLPEVVLVSETTTAKEAASAPPAAEPLQAEEAPAAPRRAPARNSEVASKPVERVATAAARPAPRPAVGSPAPRPSAAAPAPRPAAPAAAPAPRPVAVAPPPVVPQGDSGMLRINTRPWSQVHVDGRLIGNTPQMSLRLSPGKHTVLLVNPEFDMRKTLTITIKRGAVTTKIVDLAKP